MNISPRPGFEFERNIPLHQDFDDGLVLDASPAERLAMVWPLTRECWALVQTMDENVKQEFQRHIECVKRGRG